MQDEYALFGGVIGQDALTARQDRTFKDPAFDLSATLQTLDYVLPDNVARQLHDEPWFVWLDSERSASPFAQWSFMAIAPTETVEVFSDHVLLNGEASRNTLFEHLRTSLKPEAVPPSGLQVPPFAGGWMGYLAYDFASSLMDWTSRHTSNRSLGAFGYYTAYLAWDHSSRTCCLIHLDETAETSRAMDQLLEAHKTARDLAAQPLPVADLVWQADDAPEHFEGQVARIKTLIAEGDIYQANLSRRLQASLPDELSPFHHYLYLRTSNAAPFSAYLNLPDARIASTSPERFLEVRSGVAEARPIKGTIKGSENTKEDAALKAQLLASAKDRAENIMIVDLLRNDLSRVCEPFSVETPDICKLESYEGLHHLVSSVRGRLKPEFDALDLLAASFPGGSITGAPKLRAMEIIDALEASARGVYCGSIGYIGVNGDLDFSIAIRTLTYENSTASLKVGGGITLKSDPEAEYRETQTKAARMVGEVTP